MSESRNTVVSFGLVWWWFLIVKIVGHIYAAWSWWWVLMPIVPVIGQIVLHFGL